MQVWIFEAGPFLSLGPNENSSFYGGICISFNSSGILQGLSKYQLLFNYVNCITRWITRNFWWRFFDKNEAVFCQLLCIIKYQQLVYDFGWADWIFLSPAGLWCYFTEGKEHLGNLSQATSLSEPRFRQLQNGNGIC